MQIDPGYKVTYSFILRRTSAIGSIQGYLNECAKAAINKNEADSASDQSEMSPLHN